MTERSSLLSAAGPSSSIGQASSAVGSPGGIRWSGRTSEECKNVRSAPEKLTDVPRTTWLQTSMLIMGEVMGTGVLALPSAAARIGWVLSLCTVLLFAFCSSYSGSLLARVKNDFFEHAEGYADLAHATVGPRFGLFTRILIVTNWLLLLPYFMIATGASLEGLFFGAEGVCEYAWTLAAAGVMWLPSQFTTLTYISYLALPSTIAIIVALITILVAITAQASRPFGADTSAGIQPPPDKAGFEAFLAVFSALSSFVFAYQGQDMFCEIMQEMAQPREATKAVMTSYLAMSCTYTLSVVVAYGMDGAHVKGFLPEALGDGAAKAVVNLLVAFHIMVAFVLTANLVSKIFYALLFPSRPLASASTADTWQASFPVRLRWMAVQTSLLAFAYVIANLIPAFEAMQSLLGAMCAAPIVFGYPALFCVLAHRQHGRPLGALDTALCAVFLALFTPMFTVLGSIGAVLDMRDALQSATGPFSCHAA